MYQKLYPLQLAAHKLGLEFTYLDKDKVSCMILHNGESLYFINYITPFNSESVAKIMKDKFLTYCILKDFVSMPKTKAYYSPFIRKEYKELVEFPSIEKIIEDILLEFKFPLVIKMNQGMRRRNFKICNSVKEISQALENIYSKSKFTDFISLAQEKIDIVEEYRVIVYKGKIVFAYTKNKFEMIDNNQVDLLSRMQDFVDTIHVVVELGFCGLDIAIDKSNEFVLIELNSQPRFEPFIKRNGINIVEKMYFDILSGLKF